MGVMHPTQPTEVPRAYVVRKINSQGRHSSVSAGDIYRFVCGRLASYKALDGGVIFVSDIPRTPSGKIQRFKLAKMDEYRSSVTDLLVKRYPHRANDASAMPDEEAQPHGSHDLTTLPPVARWPKSLPLSWEIPLYLAR